MTRIVGLGLIAGVIIASGACASRGKEVFVRATWIRIQIGNPAAHNPASRMPPFPHITGYDLRSLAAFLRD